MRVWVPVEKNPEPESLPSDRVLPHAGAVREGLNRWRRDFRRAPTRRTGFESAPRGRRARCGPDDAARRPRREGTVNWRGASSGTGDFSVPGSVSSSRKRIKNKTKLVLKFFLHMITVGREAICKS